MFHSNNNSKVYTNKFENITLSESITIKSVMKDVLIHDKLTSLSIKLVQRNNDNPSFLNFLTPLIVILTIREFRIEDKQLKFSNCCKIRMIKIKVIETSLLLGNKIIMPEMHPCK